MARCLFRAVISAGNAPSFSSASTSCGCRYSSAYWRAIRCHFRASLLKGISMAFSSGIMSWEIAAQQVCDRAHRLVVIERTRADQVREPHTVGHRCQGCGDRCCVDVLVVAVCDDFRAEARDDLVVIPVLLVADPAVGGP